MSFNIVYSSGAVTDEKVINMKRTILVSLTIWLREVDKLAQQTCLLSMSDRQNDSLDSIIVPRMADKSIELTKHARHEWPINQPPG